VIQPFVYNRAFVPIVFVQPFGFPHINLLVRKREGNPDVVRLSAINGQIDGITRFLCVLHQALFHHDLRSFFWRLRALLLRFARRRLLLFLLQHSFPQHVGIELFFHGLGALLAKKTRHVLGKFLLETRLPTATFVKLDPQRRSGQANSAVIARAGLNARFVPFALAVQNLVGGNVGCATGSTVRMIQTPLTNGAGQGVETLLIEFLMMVVVVGRTTSRLLL